MSSILIFESDSAFATELARGLEAKDHVVTVASDARTGLDAAARSRPDLILLCLQLPDTNGFAVCRTLKRDAALKSVPVIIMASDTTAEAFEVHQKLRDRADGYIHKPIAINDLLLHIAEHLPLNTPNNPTRHDPGRTDPSEIKRVRQVALLALVAGSIAAAGYVTNLLTK